MPSEMIRDPNVVALRVQRLERMVSWLFTQAYNRDNRDINVAKDANAMVMDLKREVADILPDNDPF